MNEYFELPVTYKGEERFFVSRVLAKGYTHAFEVNVDNQLILFEPDENQNYRALLEPGSLENNLKTDINLLKAIAQVIESVK